MPVAHEEAEYESMTDIKDKAEVEKGVAGAIFLGYILETTYSG